MATRRYKISIGEKQEAVVEEAGLATISDSVELTVDLGTVVNGSAGARKPTKQEVLEAIEKLENYIVSHQWPPV